MSDRVINLKDFEAPARGASATILGNPRIERIRNHAYLVYPDVARIDRDTKWGNPFRISATKSREEAIEMFREMAVERLKFDPYWLEPLRGKRLACWCAPLPCHGDVIIELLEGKP